MCLVPVVSKTSMYNLGFPNSELKASPIVLDGRFRIRRIYLSVCMLRSCSRHQVPFFVVPDERSRTENFCCVYAETVLDASDYFSVVLFT